MTFSTLKCIQITPKGFEWIKVYNYREDYRVIPRTLPETDVYAEHKGAGKIVWLLRGPTSRFFGGLVPVQALQASR
jgi:hypothetical protein